MIWHHKTLIKWMLPFKRTIQDFTRQFSLNVTLVLSGVFNENCSFGSPRLTLIGPLMLSLDSMCLISLGCGWNRLSFSKIYYFQASFSLDVFHLAIQLKWEERRSPASRHFLRQLFSISNYPASFQWRCQDCIHNASKFVQYYWQQQPNKEAVAHVTVSFVSH